HRSNFSTGLVHWQVKHTGVLPAGLMERRRHKLESCSHLGSLHSPIDQIDNEVPLRPIHEELLLWCLPEAIILSGHTEHLHDVEHLNVVTIAEVAGDTPGQGQFLFKHLVWQGHVANLTASLLESPEDVLSIRRNTADYRIMRRNRPRPLHGALVKAEDQTVRKVVAIHHS